MSDILALFVAARMAHTGLTAGAVGRAAGCKARDVRAALAGRLPAGRERTNLLAWCGLSAADLDRAPGRRVVARREAA